MAFARDPVALYKATTLAWDTWTSACLGAGKVNQWRDGVAATTGFPGPGHVMYGTSSKCFCMPSVNDS